MNDNTSRPARLPAAPVESENTVLDWARTAGAGDLLMGGVDRYLQRRRKRRIALAATACAVLLVASGAWFSFRQGSSTAPAAPTIASTTLLRPEQRTLPDGSTIDLNAGAQIDVLFSDSFRRVVLRKGEAHFQVTKDPRRPFLVTAGAIEVRAVGTAFAVELGTSAIDVLVTEGHVAVNSTETSRVSVNPANNALTPSPPLAALAAGGHFVLDREASIAGNAATHITELSPADMLARLAWRVPRLKFAATPLAQVVAMFNEHAVAGGEGQLVLAPDIPANLNVSGILRADDVDSLLRLLAGEFGIFADRRSGEILLRRR